MGPSGSGKSTLMNLLGCLDRPTRGSYLLAGEEVATMSRDQRARIRNQRLGFVFQNFNLLARTSTLENVELPLLYARRLIARRRRKAKRSSRLVGLADAHEPSSEPALRRPAAARGDPCRRLVNEPAILMADEPTGNLDSKTSREVIGLFRDLNEQQKITVILVTHDQDVARNARRTIVLRDGGIVADTADFAQATQSLHSLAEAELVVQVEPTD
jgi:ABC-type lipoprotein export system ATPase subunit